MKIKKIMKEKFKKYNVMIKRLLNCLSKIIINSLNKWKKNDIILKFL